MYSQGMPRGVHLLDWVEVALVQGKAYSVSGGSVLFGVKVSISWERAEKHR